MTIATDAGFVEMPISKVVALSATDDVFWGVVLDATIDDRHLVIEVGEAEAISLAASLQGLHWRRPMTYQFAAALLAGLGGRVRQTRLDRLVKGAYAATVEVEGPLGIEQVDARASGALNLTAVVGAPVHAGVEVLDDCERRQTAESQDADLLRQAVTAPPVTIGRYR